MKKQVLIVDDEPDIRELLELTLGRMDLETRSADARVHEKCRLLIIKREAFEDLLFLHKDLAYEVLWSMVRILSSRLRETTDKLTFLSVSSKF